jgi:enoyl-CoA hydratase
MGRVLLIDKMKLTIERKEGNLLIRFNSPESQNSLSTDVVDAVLDAIDQIGCSSVTKVVFTGSGNAFASGADLREIGSLTSDTAHRFAKRGQELMSKIENLTVPTIAAINGYCFGGGLDLSLACKKRIASPNALFCHPGVSLGIITGWGGTQRLPRLVGEGNALEMLLTASRIPSAEAFRIGLIDSIAYDVLTEALNAPLR